MQQLSRSTLCWRACGWYGGRRNATKTIRRSRGTVCSTVFVYVLKKFWLWYHLYGSRPMGNRTYAWRSWRARLVRPMRWETVINRFVLVVGVGWRYNGSRGRNGRIDISLHDKTTHVAIDCFALVRSGPWEINSPSRQYYYHPPPS